MQPVTDPYTDSIIASLPADVRASFTETQMDALQQALSKAQGSSRHLLDWRAQLPLYWAQYYLVFLFGRDMRTHVRETLITRRRQSGRAAQIGFVALGAWLLAVGAAATLFILLYLIKSALGIDIFPDKHLSDFLGF